MEPSSRISCLETEGKNHQEVEIGHSRSNYLYKAPKQKIEQEQEEKEGRVKDLDHGTGASLVYHLLTAFIKGVLGYERNFELSEWLRLLFSW